MKMILRRDNFYSQFTNSITILIQLKNALRGWYFFFFCMCLFFYGGSVSFGCDVFINHASWKTNSMHVSVASFPAIKKYYLDLSLRLSNFSYGEHETLSCWVPRKRTDTLLLIKHGLQVRIKKKTVYMRLKLSFFLPSFSLSFPLSPPLSFALSALSSSALFFALTASYVELVNIY